MLNTYSHRQFCRSFLGTMHNWSIQVCSSPSPISQQAHNSIAVTILTRKLLDSGVVIEKLCEYLYYNLKHKDAKHVPDMEIPPSLCLELLVAADYFDGEFCYAFHRNREGQLRRNIQRETDFTMWAV